MNYKTLFQYKNFTIKIYEDPTYALNSADNLYSYNLVYADSTEYYSNRAIVIYQQDEDDFTNSAIILNSGFSGTVSYILEKDRLFLLVGDSLYCLELIALNLLWKLRCDWSACFRMFRLQDDILVHGEVEISGVTLGGVKKWVFSGADIFASVDGSDKLIINEDTIELTDFSYNYYVLDFNGKVVSEK
ncbi:MAG: hypothetical protein AAF518_28900 [Spirochaetota bacterium]